MESLSEHLEHLKSDIIWYYIKTFIAAADHHGPDEDRPCACTDGWVFVGTLV